MTQQAQEPFDRQVLHHPLIRALSDLAAEAADMALLVVYPAESGWRQARLAGGPASPPEFCRLIGASENGAKHCRMCHVLMAVGACGNGPTEQRCHAGASVLVCPGPGQTREALAVLSSCVFGSIEAWAEVAARGAQLGVDRRRLRQAFLALPRLGRDQRQVATRIMQAMAAAAYELRRVARLEAQIDQLRPTGRAARTVQEFLADSRWVRGGRRTGRPDAKMPPLVRTVYELVRQRPELPLTVKELAAAARLTPNHFSALFHRHTGRSFTDCLADERIRRAKRFLANLTLTIREIARLVGYDDPGYFARRFRGKTGVSPRAWRERGPRAPAAR